LHAHIVSPAVWAQPDPDPDLPFDQHSLIDDAPTREAYLAATRPGGRSFGRARSVAVTLFVTDLPRSVLFYRDMLLFRETDAGRGSAVLEYDDARIVLRRVASPTMDPQLVQLLLEVPDVHGAYTDLLAHGESFIHRPRPVAPYEQQVLWAAAFRDPDGHGIAITQWLPRN
jgi:catechol 2,3-dioxygenase-like lactoylglutathione lyase family enzyme